MKKIKVAMIVLMFFLLILVGIMLVLQIYNNISVTVTIDPIIISKSEIQNSLEFEVVNYEYESIEDVVFYDKNVEMDETLKNNLTIIAKELKIKYPNKTILFLEDRGTISTRQKAMYHCMQLINGQKIERAQMMFILDQNDNIEILIERWEDVEVSNNINLTKEDIEQIIIDYLAENPSDYNQLKTGFSTKTGILELCNYKSRTCWKIEFKPNESTMIIDANTGEILDKYFFNGIIID